MMSILRPLRGHVRGLLAGVGIALVVVLVVVVGLLDTLPPVRPNILPGDIWLTSRAVGQLTLVDGVSAGVSAAAGVTGAGVQFDSVQDGVDGYAIGVQQGKLTRVSGATLQKDSVTLSDLPLQVLPVKDALFAVDRQDHSVRAVSADRLEALGGALPLYGSSPAVASDGTRLWAADSDSGDVTEYGIQGRASARVVHTGLLSRSTTPARIVVADGKPVVVDGAAGAAVLLDPDHAGVLRSMKVSLRGTDEISGSSDSSDLIVVQKGRGLLQVCSFTGGECGPAVPVADTDDDIGAAVEFGGHAYVPDYTAGDVRVVSVSELRMRRTKPLFDRRIHFELLERDGIVYFNDPDSEKAGVVLPTAEVRRIDKYTPPQPTTGVTTSGPHPSHSGPPTPTPTRAPGKTGSSIPVAAGTAVASGGTSSVTATTTSTAGPRILGVTSSPPTPEVGDDVTISADVSGVPDTWFWKVSRPDGRAEAQTRDTQLRHTFTQPGQYIVDLVITTGSYRDEQSMTLAVIPASPPVVCGEVLMASVVLKKDLDCPGTALTVGANDITVDLGGHKVSGTDRGILVNKQTNVTLTNGTIGGGVDFERTTSSALSNLTVDNFTGFSTADGKVTNTTFVGNLARFAASTSYSFVKCTFVNSGIFPKSSGGFLVSGSTAINSNFSFNGGPGGITMVGDTFTRSRIGSGESGGDSVTDTKFLASSLGFGVVRHINIQNDQFSGADAALTYGEGASEDALIQGNTFTGNNIGLKSEAGELAQIDGATIADNTFVNNAVAGMYLSIRQASTSQVFTIRGNRFISNGHAAGGVKDFRGHLIDDGLHVDSGVGDPIRIEGNVTRDNADYGIEAQPGTVIDGGGNTSSGNPSGCLGVVCR